MTDTPRDTSGGRPASVLRYAVSVPPHGDYGDPRRLADLAREAEDAGWDGFFLWDHLMFMRGFRGPIVDPWISLAAVATATSVIRFGPMVTPLARRRPWKVAREAVTLDHLSGGRLILGVGLGYPRDSEFDDFGEDGDERIRAEKLDEALDIITGLWSGEPFAYQGRHFRIAETTFLPRPVQRPRIPVWVAGYWPNRRPFRRAARWDGVLPGRLSLERRKAWTPTMIPTGTYGEIVSYVHRHRTADGPFDYAVGGYTAGDGGQADRRLVTSYADVGVTWWFENLHGFRGPFDATRERIRLGPPRVERA
ncbi:LLM class flavin-dependent oxidoreductase [Streptomyces yaizuensis]|uniref:LLM class flavin-dependent oxidoreductase n=1 Tax=Streptomyces yaizuensis TaxID=2989713 RepID=A0ABQ5NRE7_9ACTN|nr:LLM class flavin-dependent oxidoreductase [Streptomyces sp. YSPA8]GLF92905.1 LLM class flavin-dependent oxidoreductase [Streptomyces sp. YSPA8]